MYLGTLASQKMSPPQFGRVSLRSEILNTVIPIIHNVDVACFVQGHISRTLERTLIRTVAQERDQEVAIRRGLVHQAQMRSSSMS